MSRLPSALKSPVSIANGQLPAENGELVASEKAPVPSPMYTVTVLLPALGSPEFAVAKSRWLSLLKSPNVTSRGASPTRYGDPLAGERPPEPSPRRTLTVSAPSLDDTTSR